MYSCRAKPSFIPPGKNDESTRSYLVKFVLLSFLSFDLLARAIIGLLAGFVIIGVLLSDGTLLLNFWLHNLFCSEFSVIWSTCSGTIGLITGFVKSLSFPGFCFLMAPCYWFLVMQLSSQWVFGLLIYLLWHHRLNNQLWHSRFFAFLWRPIYRFLFYDLLTEIDILNRSY